jgi:hypothetical protein
VHTLDLPSGVHYLCVHSFTNKSLLFKCGSTPSDSKFSAFRVSFLGPAIFTRQKMVGKDSHQTLVEAQKMNCKPGWACN